MIGYLVHDHSMNEGKYEMLAGPTIQLNKDYEQVKLSGERIVNSLG